MRRVVLLCLLFVATARAEETLLLRESSIKAMEGLPAVTFVVPWQASEPGDFIAPPADSMLDDQLRPFDASLLPQRLPRQAAPTN